MTQRLERPILFSVSMVRAIVELEGRKTQTRRLITPQPSAEESVEWLSNIVGRAPSWCRTRPMKSDVQPLKCPYGMPGDRLWVRETWQPIWATDDPPPYGLKRPDGWRIGYPATDGLQEWCNQYADRHEDSITVVCKPSIHMPRWASRITLEITEVRAQRLHDISEEDARAEGVDWAAPQPWGERWDDDREDPRVVGYPPVGSSFARDNFRRLWDSINRKRAPWDSNPWVWAVTFQRIEAQG